MDYTCKTCGQSFVCSYPRTVCWRCVSLFPHVSIDSLLEAYNKGLSQPEIAKNFGVSKTYVSACVRSYTPMRRHTVSTTYYGKVTLDLDWLDGWLLGDGCLNMHSHGSVNVRGNHGSKYEEYVQYVVANWERQGLKHSRIYVIKHVSESGVRYTSYMADSHAHPLLTAQWHRWYPDGKKRVPPDVRFTPTSLREWYLGDGCFSKCRQTPQFYLGNLTEEEAIFLYKNIKRIFGEKITLQIIKPRVTSTGDMQKQMWVINFRKESTPDFFSYIGPCPITCYAYKWPHS